MHTAQGKAGCILDIAGRRGAPGLPDTQEGAVPHDSPQAYVPGLPPTGMAHTPTARQVRLSGSNPASSSD
eukprot:4131893-Prymnesium_polylepis.1